MIVLGWLLGIIIGSLLVLLVLVALALPIPAVFAFLLGLLTLPSHAVGLLIAIVLLVLWYLLGYVVASRSIAASLPTTAFPLLTPFPTPGGVPVALPASAGELFARGMMIGSTAAMNAIVLSIVAGVGLVLGFWAFLIISLSIVTAVARNRVYHGFLGWSGWLFPVSWFATSIGLLLFLINLPFAFAAAGIAAFRLDFSTGVLESAGGLVGMPVFVGAFTGGFSLGNFTFETSTALQGNFLAPSVSSHETGHSLNTAAMGGIVLWINAVDENIPPIRKMNLAYGELTAESHTMALPGTPRAEFFVRLWG